MSKKDNHQLNEDDLRINLEKIAYSLDKTYLSRLDDDFKIIPYDNYNSDKSESDNQPEPINSYVSNVRALKVLRLVYDEGENTSDCMQNALSVFAFSDNTIALVCNRTVRKTEIYAVVKNNGRCKNEESMQNIKLLREALKSNFYGSDFSVIQEKSDGEDTKKIFFDDRNSLMDKYSSIAALCGIPSAKSEKYLSQNLEKIFNGLKPKDDNEVYTLILLAESLPDEMIDTIRDGYEELATAIFPYGQHSFQKGENNTLSFGEMTSLADTKGTSIAISNTHSVSASVFASKAMALGSKAKKILGSKANASGANIGASVGYGYSHGKTKTTTESRTYTHGYNNSISVGTSENTTYSFQSYKVKRLANLLEQSMERVRTGKALGFWRYSAYICACNPRVCKNVACMLQALMQGTKSFTEPFEFHLWNDEKVNGLNTFEEAKKYICNFTHPVFENNNDGMTVNFSINLTTDELSHVMLFPQRSVQGLPVVKGVSFAREPHSLTKQEHDIEIGCGYHLFQTEKSNTIFLSRQELTKHTFITGSTGSGKSTAVYRLLHQLKKSGTKFLVIEPAKGEYREAVGKNGDVAVFGTNPLLSNSKLLRLNPFRFPSHTHILEHLDRLVEIFNICWPMYAAMPAILKDAIERAYQSAGWDLYESANRYGEAIFPSFGDVAREIRRVLSESEYSDDNKGDYTGALVTRLRSLTNGLNGVIFSAADVDDSCIFDSNAIIDLSRIGSSETKSLIMGLLILKLQEYRAEQRFRKPVANQDLRHITVLEEAHHLLKKASIVSNESGNLQGKSVEMIANAIAEMRTFGEGFVIVDQAPGLLDPSVIRNTNTKMILRLPDLGDRETVGKAAGLNDQQIDELSRFETGVAAITQSGWIEPVLCKINDDYEDDEVKKSTPELSADADSEPSEKVSDFLRDYVMSGELHRLPERTDLIRMKNAICRSSLDTPVKCAFLDCVGNGGAPTFVKLSKLAYEFFHGERAFAKARQYEELNKLTNVLIESLEPSVKDYSEKQIDKLLALLIKEQSVRDATYIDLFVRFTEVSIKEGSVFRWLI